MNRSASHILRLVLAESSPLRRFPIRVLRQLVGYYGDWRRSRDILGEADDTPRGAGFRFDRARADSSSPRAPRHYYAR